MKLKQWLSLVPLAAPTIYLSGCATSELWEEGRFARFYDPARPTNLQVFQSPQKKDFLVQYDDELRDDRDSVRRRAYWLVENGEPVRNPHKPQYVPPNQAEGLAALPIFDAGITTQPPAGFHVVVSTNHQDFTRYSGGQNLGEYELPVYGDSSGRVKQVLLTPLAVAADITVIGGFIFLQAWASGGLNCIH